MVFCWNSLTNGEVTEVGSCDSAIIFLGAWGEIADLNYFGMRYYDADIGLWTSVDPARQFWSPYGYGGNPVNGVDPNGMEFIYDSEGNDITEEALFPDDPSMYWQMDDGTLMYLGEMGGDVYVAPLFDNMLIEHGTAAMDMSKIQVYEMIKTGGEWDFKNNPSSIFHHKLSSKNTYHYNGQAYRYDDFGNYHFGYVVRKNGWPLGVSKLGAGVVQIKQGTSSWSYYGSYFDDPRDSKMIESGYNHNW